MALTSVMDIISAADRYRMFEAGDKVLAAVSGGPDSVAMLHALHTRSSEFGISLHVAHLNHGIRGEQSDLDEEFVRGLAHELRLECSVEKADIPSFKKELGVGEEEAARIARYRFLQKAATGVGADKIALGHTADDRAESVLLNIIRGTGVGGLGSIRPVRGNVVRPLIDTPRSQIEAYIAEHALPYRIDESNIDVTYARNRVRHELIPLLERDYNPQVRAALIRLADIAAMESDIVEETASEAARGITYRGSYDAGLFLGLPVALQYQIIRSEIQRLKGDLKDVTFEQAQRVIEALAEGSNFTITLPSGRIYAVRRGNEFRIEPKKKPIKHEAFECEIAVPGITRIPEIGLTLETHVQERVNQQGRIPPNEAVIDADAVVGALRVRNVLRGDRIVPFGMRGTKKLQDVFVDKKIARNERAKAAVVVDDEKVLWVVGVVSSEAVRVSKKTGRVIRLVAFRT